MEYNEIEFKKPSYKIKAPLREHLRQYSRLENLPITYDDLTRYQDLIPMNDIHDNPTLWYSALYNQNELDFLKEQLIKVYELLITDGDKNPYSRIVSIDFCSFGNSKPFRIKVVNEANDNHDYFYIKRADASRIYGLEIEEIFSPDKILFLVDNQTLVEEHIVGVPCDEFISKNKHNKINNRLRFATEFVKFNERCFTRLLGDMRAYNFVVEIIQDFDTIQYRFRPIDFDQQCYEGRKNMYLPQFYVDNRELVELAQELLSIEVANQYMREERVAMKKRYLTRKQRTKSLFRRMKRDNLSTPENRNNLAKELKAYHNNYSGFTDGMSMGEILVKHMELKLGIKFFE
ncbi:hypothetical protein DNU06_06845 [Putridiphycobacter roseus]|uniref:Uncharacterized protein n=1 Tax=Putridiphycobacter roseus TaxID=2219161 RepID=A0A2W1MZ96_9FLAO|nr:hypothetical protein [Putridiphycobacter roseus]PZE17539.1 hypothetical protein DNU06_06845 [Putridiphycobacter roseus]